MFRASARKRYLRSITCFCLPAFTLLIAATAHAQIGGTGIDDDRSSGMRLGMNTIVGRVVFPLGRQPDRRCTVRLSSVRVGEFSTVTDDGGVFTFRRLREGSYFITVEAGKDYLPTQETVDLFDNRPRTTTVQIDLRLRPTPATKPAVVNAGLAGMPKPALELYQQGMQLAAAGKFREAIEKLKSAVSLYPEFVMALNELSGLYVNLGDLDPAAEALRTALKFEPDNPTLRLNYGYVLLLRERFVDSERELRRAVQLKDDSVMAHLYHGRVLVRLRNFDEAEKELNRALSIGGNSSVNAYRYLGALYSENGDTSKAIEALENYLKHAPNAKDSEQVRAIIRQLQAEATSKKN